MNLIKLVSTKVRRRVVKIEWVFWTAIVHYKSYNVIQLKAFGLFWINYIEYSFKIDNVDTVKLREVCPTCLNVGTIQDIYGDALKCPDCEP